MNYGQEFLSPGNSSHKNQSCKMRVNKKQESKRAVRTVSVGFGCTKA